MEDEKVRAYPVTLAVEAPAGSRNRLTVAVRALLALPHAVLVGPIYWSFRTGGVGLLGAAAYVLAVVSWFTLLVTGEHLAGIREFTMYYLRWRTRAVAYMALFVDAYPPFGDAPYPVTIDVAAPAMARDRASVAVRLFLAIPHLVVLPFLLFAWLVTTVIAWFAIVITGGYPRPLYAFGVGTLTWALRVEAYLLLMVDAYPPFEFAPSRDA